MPKMVYFDGRRSDVKNFSKNLNGARVAKADRAAKILIIKLSNGYTLLIHLKLTGQLIYRAKNGNLKRGGHPWPSAAVEVPNKWTHIIFYFSDGSKLYFNDLRQFGYLKLIKTKKIGEQKELKKLGPERQFPSAPLSKQKKTANGENLRLSALMRPNRKKALFPMNRR